MKKIHLMAICGMGMGSLAGMLKEAGYEVRGSDEQVYPPMSTQLQKLGIPYFEGFKPSNLDWNPDLVVVGNVITRVNLEAVALRERGIPYSSLPQTLAEFFIRDRHSVVVTGTHGKTTTTGIIAWALEHAGRHPGFMVGGILKNFDINYRIGTGDYFVVEGDEYDTAYFDKVPKFVHYRPRTGIITSIEYDHADIYESLDRIKQEFRKFVELIPSHGLLVAYIDDPNVREVIATPASPVETYGYSIDADWQLREISLKKGQTIFTVYRRGNRFGRLHTTLIGQHNLLNLLGATAVLHHLGLTPKEIDAGFKTFAGTKRRQEVRGVINDIVVIDDFAHHPTAVRETIAAVKAHYVNNLRNREGRKRKLWSIFEPRTATTRRDVFQQDYVTAFLETDLAIIAEVHRPDKAPEGHRFSPDRLVEDLRKHAVLAYDIDKVEDIVRFVAENVESGDNVLIMSNGDFGGIHERLLAALRQRFDE